MAAAPPPNVLRVQSMGLAPTLSDPRAIFKRKFRYRLKIKNIIGEGYPALPPNKAARPKLQFKEIEVQHLNEIIHFPGKPEWQTVNFQIYDLNCYYREMVQFIGGVERSTCDITCTTNPIWEWVKKIYDPKNDAAYKFCINDLANEENNLKRTATLEILDGCGSCIERWVYENAWPTSWDFQEVDMASNDVLFIDLTMRYDRAYIETCQEAQTGTGNGITTDIGPQGFPELDERFSNLF